MAVKHICDNCGEENAGRVTMDIARSTPLEMPKDFPKLDVDLCQRCFDALLRTIRPVLAPNPK